VVEHKPEHNIPFGDKFYYQQNMRVAELPADIERKMKQGGKEGKKRISYSQNLMVVPGRRGLHIFDVDREKWIFNSSKNGYKYEDLYYSIKNFNEQGVDAHMEDEDEEQDQDGPDLQDSSDEDPN
jgi:hypothetical protein